MSLEIADFTTLVAGIIDELDDLKKKGGIIVSDVLDEEDNQYVDLVMEGGGVLGIALVGYTYVLEQMGIRFLKIAGTSAGAINALMLASIGEGPNAKKSEKSLEYLSTCKLSAFVDGDDGVKNFIAYMLSGDKASEEKTIPADILSIFKKLRKKGQAGIVDLAKALGINKKIVKSLNVPDWLTKIEELSPIFPTLWRSLFILDDLIGKEQLGLNPGRKIERWLEETIAKEGVLTMADLSKKLAKLPELHERESEKSMNKRGKIANLCCELALITADISTETKVVFPKMANLFWEDCETINPAKYVRASMSIPFFFEPMRVKSIDLKTITNPEKTKAYRKSWKGLGYNHDQDGWPTNHVFVDGGTISNFPIGEFHQSEYVPLAPTFGVKLGRVYKRKKEIESLWKLTGAVYNSARHSMDNDFINKNPDYQHLIQNIDTGDHNWLNFNLDDAAKLDLFKSGANAASEFLKKFDWEKYKEIRRVLCGAHDLSQKLEKE
jgi:NTE family protein